MGSGALKTITGSLLVGGGVTLVLFAVDSHGHGASRAVAVTAPPACPSAECPRCAPASTAASTVPSASASAAPSASASAAPSASASAAPSASASGASFRFAPGDIALAKGEVPRLVAHAAELRRSTGKISIEGFADASGADDKATSLARRRGVLARQLLADIGLDAERLVVTVGDVSAEPEQAGQVRVRVREGK